MLNPYMPVEAEILDVVDENSAIKTYVLKPREPIHFQPGHFVMAGMPGVGESPFGVSSSCFEDDTLAISVQIQPRGKNTTALHKAKRGDIALVRGPFGNSYPMDYYKGREVYVVGGGVGMAPMRSVLLALLHESDKYKSIVLRYGARNPELRMYKDLCLSWETDPRIDAVYTVDVADESWPHNVGVVTSIMKPEDIKDVPNAVAVACGPPIMLRFMVPLLLKMGFKPEHMYFSMEKNMSCGMGLCGHCRIGTYYVCKDGPVFTYDQICDFPDAWS
ncbi:MAG: FAD/NAD(P)-binding protein [Dehalococcoidia bacterium]|nr:FAD/NAD(P)-binding protein [Dehalococcoidia bacterium]